MKFIRRVGLNPHVDGQSTGGITGCPDIWELEDGKFAVIGVDKTQELYNHLPEDAGCGPDEKIVVLDRHILLNAKAFIPES